MRRLIALLAFVPLTAAAQDIPRYDPQAYCESDTDSHSLYNLCIDDEQQYYDHLRSAWPSVPEDIRQYCIADNQGALPSYALLDLCVSDETEAASNKSTFSFD